MERNFEPSETGIPAARDRAQAVANRLKRLANLTLELATANRLRQEAAELEKMISENMYRRKPVKLAPVQHHVTREQREAIIEYAAMHPSATNHEIAEACGVGNQGRVSEILRGKRK